MRAAKKCDLPFSKTYKQNITGEVFEIFAIPTVISPLYSLADAEKDEINRKFYEKEFWLEPKQITTKMGNNEFAVHFISTTSMDYFPSNTPASFINFFKKKLALDGDWRVAISEIIFHWH